MAGVSIQHHIGHRLLYKLLLVVPFLVWRVSECSSQYHVGGIPQGYYGGVQQYPVYMGSYYPRPQNFRWPTYGYDYNVGNIRTTPDSYDQMIDNAQKAAMQPLNNIMASQADGLVPQPPIQRSPEMRSSQSVQGGDDAAGYAHQMTISQSKQCRTPDCPSAEATMTEDRPIAKSLDVTAEPATVSQTHHPQTFQHGIRQYAPPHTSCPQCPPCSHPYTGFNVNSGGFTRYTPKLDNHPQVYYSYYPSYPQGASRSARTFWLPWLNGGSMYPQNTIGFRYHNPYKLY